MGGATAHGVAVPSVSRWTKVSISRYIRSRCEPRANFISIGSVWASSKSLKAGELVFMALLTAFVILDLH